MNKILYIDTETGGLNTETDALLQLSGIVEINGKVKETFNYFIKPFEGAVVTEKALEIQGRTSEDFKSGEDEKNVHNEFVTLLDKYIDKFDKNDKFTVAGYNVRFDIEVLQNFFTRNNNDYLFSYIGNKTLDPLFVIPVLQLGKQLPFLSNDKLETWCDYFEIELKAHDSLNDITATRELLENIKNITNVGRGVVDADSVAKKLKVYRELEKELDDAFPIVFGFAKNRLETLYDGLPVGCQPTKKETWELVSSKVTSRLLELKEQKKALLKLGFKVKDTRYIPVSSLKLNAKGTVSIFTKYKRLFKLVEEEYL